MLRDPQSRNSDKHLMYMVWTNQGIDLNDYIQWFKEAAHPKSIIESRRNLQRNQEEKIKAGEIIPENEILIADKKVLKYREEIDRQRGTHIFRDEIADQQTLI